MATYKGFAPTQKLCLDRLIPRHRLGPPRSVRYQREARGSHSDYEDARTAGWQSVRRSAGHTSGTSQESLWKAGGGEQAQNSGCRSCNESWIQGIYPSSSRIGCVRPYEGDRQGESSRQSGFRPFQLVQQYQYPKVQHRAYSSSSRLAQSQVGSIGQVGRRKQQRSEWTGHRPIVLGLESSADDTCAAIVDAERKIWSNVVIKQHETNAKFGGIQPLEALQMHQANMASDPMAEENCI